ncbi:MAG: 4-hydroxythreonine-4-phosphate dehydrogenase PdxA [Campylobacterales bacterium]
MRPKIAITLGEPNGVGLEIALRAHWRALQLVDPLYIGSQKVVEQGAQILGIPIPEGFQVVEPPTLPPFQLEPGVVTREGGLISFKSFQLGVELAAAGKVDGVMTLPIQKEGWQLAGIPFKGHTDYLRHRFRRPAIMMMGVPELMVGLYTEHIPLSEVPARVKRDPLQRFLLQFYRETQFPSIGVLGLNPHAGDRGVLGREELEEIGPAIEGANRELGREIFFGPLVPDVAFIHREGRFVALYHDQGLAPLKALYFREVINVTLGLPIKRASVGHGTGMDIAFKRVADLQSYLNGLKWFRGEIGL